LIFNDHAGHLTRSTEELDLLTLDQRRVPAVRGLKKRLHRANRKTHQKRMVSNFLYSRLLPNSPIQPVYEHPDSIPSRLTLAAIAPEPQLNLAGDYLIMMFDALAPVLQYTGLYKTVLDAPRPNVTEFRKELAPSTKAKWQGSASSP
jgi:hypothetical protein